MIIYNVTINVEESIVDDWLKWMQDIHIPEVMKTDIFIKSQINKIIVQGDTGFTYAVAYTCKNMKDLHQYQIKFAPDLQKKHNERYGEKVVVFRTLMELINEF